MNIFFFSIAKFTPKWIVIFFPIMYVVICFGYPAIATSAAFAVEAIMSLFFIYHVAVYAPVAYGGEKELYSILTPVGFIDQKIKSILGSWAVAMTLAIVFFIVFLGLLEIIPDPEVPKVSLTTALVFFIVSFPPCISATFFLTALSYKDPFTMYL